MSSNELAEDLVEVEAPGLQTADADLTSDPVSGLPLELSTLIFSYLEADHLFAASLVSKGWRKLVNADTLWKRICIRHDLRDENFPFEFGAVTASFPGPKGWCRWAHIYRTLLYRRRSWKQKDAVLHPRQEANSFGIHGTTLAIASRDGNVSVLSTSGYDIIPVQKIEVGAAIRDVHVALNTIVCLVGDWAAILRLENGEFQTEAVFDPEGEHRHDRLTDLKNTDTEPRKTKTLLVTEDKVWFATSVLKIYCRSSGTFIRHQVTHIIDVKHNHNWVAILRPDSVDLFRHNGSMEFSIGDGSFYTGLVMSNCAVAFLESPDFDNPVAVYLDLATRKKTVLDAKTHAKLQVYKLTMHRDQVFCLSGLEKVELSCHQSTGEIKWIRALLGSKYLRPGKDFFTVICSKFIFLSPAQVRLDVFDLYDMHTGNQLYTFQLHSSSNNIREVSDTGLTIMVNSSSDMCGSSVSWISMA